jgi:hypothetical protein
MSAPAVSVTEVKVTRSRRSPLWPAAGAIVVIAILAYLPYLVYAGTTSLLVNFFILLIMASMWNLLAGYAGLVSVGQQAFIGMGSYLVLIVALHGTDPFIGLPVAALGCAVLGLVVWWLLSRLRSGYFAIATWVIASICYLVVIRFASLGGGTGEPLPGLPAISNTLLNAYTYWVAHGGLLGAVDGRDDLRLPDRRHRHDRGTDPRHDRVLRAPAVAGQLRDLVFHRARRGGHRGGDLGPARAVGAHLRAPAHPALPGRLLGLAGGPGRRARLGPPAAATPGRCRPAVSPGNRGQSDFVA